MSSVSFDAFDLDPRILEAIARLEYEEATPIQAAAIAQLLDGRDVIGRARTGSGKTAAFGLPLVHRVRDGGRTVRALILAPTRELAQQVSVSLRSYARRLEVAVLAIYGGTPYREQLQQLRRGVDVVVGTPGRVLDHIERGTLDLSDVEIVVLDEADEMLRMGFIEDVDRILGETPPTRQVALFSATMPDAIRRVADAHLHCPVEVQVEDTALSVGHVEQRWMRVPERHKLEALIRVLTASPGGTTLAFARTRVGCAEVADELARRGLSVDALHGDLNQGARDRVLARLRAGRLRVVIATDVAARGIDVQHISHVINLDVPETTEGYVHRIGRTSRAGAKGLAITFVTPKQKRRVRQLQHELKVQIEQVPVPSDAAIARQRQRALARDLESVLAGEELNGARAFVAGLVEEVGRTAEDVAVAAIDALARLHGVPLGAEPDPDPPPWSVPTQSDRQHGDPGDLDEVELFFPVGSRHGIRPADIVGALANEAGIPGARIGRISIYDRKSFVGLPRTIAERVITAWSKLELRGQVVSLQLARPRAKDASRRSRPGSHGPKRWGGGRGVGKKKRSKPWKGRKGKR